MRAPVLAVVLILPALIPGCKKCGSTASSSQAAGERSEAGILVTLPGGKGTLRPALRATEVELRRPIGAVNMGSAGILLAYPRARALGVSLRTATSEVDVVLLDQERRVLKAASDLPAAEPVRVDVIPELYQYALVLPKGAASVHGFQIGQTLGFELPEALRPARVLLPVTLLPPSRASVMVLAELALGPEETSMGLMYRRSLPPKGGMLFRFPREEVLWFFMKNTRISLDMIFINQARQVTGVVHRARPFDENTVGVGSIPNRYVLEVVAGFARRHGIVVGTRVSFQLPEPLSRK